MNFRRICLVAVFSVCVGVYSPAADAQLLKATNTFLDGIDADAKAATQRDFDSDIRLDWHFIPKNRLGVSLKDLDQEQRELMLNVLRAGLSEQGYTKAETIRSLELVLREIEGSDHRDPERYHLLVFGEPSDSGAWGVRYEGHHLSLSWTFLDGKVVASSPQFFGSNPGDVGLAGSMKGVRVLGKEEDLGRALVQSLDDAQRSKAIISEEAPDDILTSASREAMMQKDIGIAFDDLNKKQQKMLIDVLEEMANVQSRAEAKRRMKGVREVGFETLKFAWMGGVKLGEPHYYRIQGPTFIVEYDNVQNGANHPHTAWRDFKGDFGRDVLRLHHLQAHNGGIEH